MELSANGRQVCGVAFGRFVLDCMFGSVRETMGEERQQASPPKSVLETLVSCVARQNGVSARTEIV
jgi:hypothetical protein